MQELKGGNTDLNILKFLKPKSTVAYIDSGSTMRQAIEKLHYHGYTAIPVINDKGEYVGTLSEGDILWNLYDKRIASITDSENIRIIDILREDFNPAMKIDAQPDEFFERILSQNFIPVIDDRGVFVGIITRRDVLSSMRS